MNYYAHAVPFLDDPYFVAGTAIPDWLAVADRRVRVRSKHALLLVDDADPATAAVARGMCQHFSDDAGFHQTRAFAELSLELTVLVRDALAGEGTSFRPAFLGHLLIEVLLDASLIVEDPSRLERYYRLLNCVDGLRVQEAVNRMAPRPIENLAYMIQRFCEERILWDYLEDDRLLLRLNQIMNRVRLSPLPEQLCSVFSEIRRRVEQAKPALLANVPAGDTGIRRAEPLSP